MTDEAKRGLLARFAGAPLATAGALGVLSQASKVAEVALNAPGVGALAASVIVAIGFGLSSINLVNDDRAKRVAHRLVNDSELTIDQYRAVWNPKTDREAVLRQLRSQLEAIDRAEENEVADALLNALRYRTLHPEDRRFGASTLTFFRDARFEELQLTKKVLGGALRATPDDPLSLLNNRSLSDQKQEPGVLVTVNDTGAGGHGAYVCPANAVVVRRAFRRIKEADLARSTGMTVGSFMYDGSPGPPETDEDSLVIGRMVAEKLAALIP
jgi:hypothetical protein